MLLRKCVLCLLFALAASIAAHADSPPQPIPADGKCAVPVDPNWTNQEKFVWVNVCIGDVANFNNEPGYGGDLDPRSPTGLPNNRILRSSFLETILLKDKYRSALTRLGVRIIGAPFTETVDLEHAALQHDLWLVDSLLERGANLTAIETSNQISLDGSKIFGTFNAAQAQINKNLLMRRVESSDVDLLRAHIGIVLDLSDSKVTGMLKMNAIRDDRSLFLARAKFNEIDLTAANIGGNVDLTSSTVTGMLNMNAIRDDRSLFLARAKFNEIDLTAANIGGNVDLTSSTVTGILDMNTIDVHLNLIMRQAQFKDIELIGAHIRGQINLNGSTVTGMLGMYGTRVDQNLIMHNKARFNEIDLTGAHIGGRLEPRNSTITGMLKMTGIRIDQSLLMNEKAHFNEIDLTGAHIGGQLDLSTSTVKGKLEAKYIDVERSVDLGNDATFRNEIDFTSAKLGQDFHLSGSTFNNHVDLTGAQIGGVLSLKSTLWLGSAALNLTSAAVGEIDLSHNWPDKIYMSGLTYHNLSNLAGNFSRAQAETWFGKQAYAPQPYEQLATILKSNGWTEDATAILYAGKKQERQTASGLNLAWLTLLNYSIGFGYHLEFAFYWAVGFVLLGWTVLYATGQRTKYGMTLGLAYSFDMLLPLVQLRKKHYEIDLDPWPQRYFFAHKIVGVILSSFIVAGITGLTK